MVFAASILLAACYPFQAHGQDFQDLNAYSRLSVGLKANLFYKGTTETLSGNYPVQSKHMFSGQLGLEYALFPADQWDLKVGAYIGIPPVHHLEVFFSREDIYPDYPYDEEVPLVTYGFYSLNLPLVFTYKTRLKQNLLLSFGAGFQYMYMPSGYIDYSVNFGDTQTQQEKQVFTLEAESSDAGHYSGALLSVGTCYLTAYGLFECSLELMGAFQPLFTGEYRVFNLRNAPDSHGRYSLSGHYLGLNLKYSWKKKTRSPF